MDLQARFDELDNIVSTLRILRNEITDKDYIEQLDYIREQASNEMQDVSNELDEEYYQEQNEMERQYIFERI